MSVITFPTALRATKFAWSQRRNDLESRSVFGAQSVEVAAPVWEATIEAPPQFESAAGAWKSLLLQLRGKTNQLELWDKGRPAPLGTMRGSMALTSGVSAGAVTLPISSSGQAGTTLLAGDLLGIGSASTQQVVMVMAAATANGSGDITVTVEPPLRNAFSLGAVVTWDKPKALFRRAESRSDWEYSFGMARGFRLSLIEDWRP